MHEEVANWWPGLSPRFWPGRSPHASFNAGGLAGAGLGALAAGAGVGPRAHFGSLMLAAILVAVAGGPRLLPHEASESPPSPVLARLPRRLLVLGAAAFLTQLAEGAAADWSAVYFLDSLTPPPQWPLSAAPAFRWRWRPAAGSPIAWTDASARLHSSVAEACSPRPGSPCGDAGCRLGWPDGNT